MKRFLGAVLSAVIALGSLALVLPTPTASACKNCRAIQCPPCYQLTGGNCNHCATCQKIPGCAT